MKLFKSVDDKLLEIGFKKELEDGHGCRYTREDKDFHFVQCVDIIKKTNGKHILHSYDANSHENSGNGCACIGLTSYEMELFTRKMKQIGLYSK